MSAGVYKWRRVLGEVPYERWATADQVARAASVSYRYTAQILRWAHFNGTVECYQESLPRGGRRFRYRKLRGAS